MKRLQQHHYCIPRSRASIPETRTGSMLVVCLIGLALLSASSPRTATAADGGDTSAKVVVIGFDGMDPDMLREYIGQGIMPNFERFINNGGDLQKFGTSIPPQSPVAWSNFTTGQNPGGHGIFDFIHRDPQTMHPFLSTSLAKRPEAFWQLGGWKVPRGGGGVENLRKGLAFWEILSDAGIDATVFKVPANFPPVECEARTLSGMGTPDILGTYGIFTYLTDDPIFEMDSDGARLIHVWPENGKFTSAIPGPINTYREGDPQTEVPLNVTIDAENKAAVFEIGNERFLLQEGEWSDWITLEFEMVKLFKSVYGICRFYLLEVEPYFRLYVTPVQIDPSQPEMPISTPPEYSKEIARDVDLFFTQGLPEDTKALEKDVLSDAQYISLADLIREERLDQFKYELDRFRDLDKGLLFFYFNTPDQSTHMHWRNMDEHSPNHDTADSTASNRIRNIYVALDEALQMAVERCGDDSLIMVISDHGFAPFYRCFHVNTWLLENGYLALRMGTRPENVNFLMGIDWTRTRAYAVGINCVYLNLRGREKRGIVDPGAEREALLQELVAGFEASRDPESDQPSIKYAYRADQVYQGQFMDTAPDIILGYYRGWRGSNESALGAIPPTIYSDNMDKWSGDHCMAADEVPGIIMTNRRIIKQNPSLVDMAPTILALFGLEPLPEMIGSDIFAESGEK